jgi:hypothetical protein
VFLGPQAHQRAEADGEDDEQEVGEATVGGQPAQRDQADDEPNQNDGRDAEEKDGGVESRTRVVRHPAGEKDRSLHHLDVSSGEG